MSCRPGDTDYLMKDDPFALVASLGCPVCGHPEEKDKYEYHPSAVIEDGAEIGDGSNVWHFCHIEGTAKIGEQCTLGHGCYVGNHVLIGDRCRVQNNVNIFTGVIIQDDVFIGPGVTFTNVLTPRAGIDRMDQPVPTFIKSHVSIGANATILCGVIIGEYAMVGAGAVVTRNVMPYTIVKGNPARPSGSVCRCGGAMRFSCNGPVCGVCKALLSEATKNNDKFCRDFETIQV